MSPSETMHKLSELSEAKLELRLMTEQLMRLAADHAELTQQLAQPVEHLPSHERAHFEQQIQALQAELVHHRSNPVSALPHHR